MKMIQKEFIMEKILSNEEILEKILPYKTLRRILDNVFDEIFVYDSNYRVVYVNDACRRHYGLSPNEMIGKTFQELLKEEAYWYPSLLPIVYKEKKFVTMEQTFYFGHKIVTTGVPLFNENEEIEFVIFCCRDDTIKQQLMRQRIEAENKIKEKTKNETVGLEQLIPEEKRIIYKSEEMKKVMNLAKVLAQVDTTLLIYGETGTGKSLLARYIHDKSSRSENPFLEINCAAIPEGLLESELFGYTKGAFTGADEMGKIGLAEMADRGTLFLDEIGELTPKLQSKLLQVIQDKRFIPIGGKESITVDVRIITATNNNLYEMVQNKKFREDLYWRLNVVDIETPPLRKRKEDVIVLSNYFLKKLNEKYKFAKYFSKNAMNKLINHSWPGNVRELQNLVERLVITSPKPTIMAEDFPGFFDKIGNAKLLSDIESFDVAVEAFEKSLIVDAFNKYKSSRKISEKLNISQSKANRLINKYCK